MPSPILSMTRKESTDETWATAAEEEPLLEASKAKAASVTSHHSLPATPIGIDPVPAPPGTAPIQLPPDVDLSADYPFNNQPITTSSTLSEPNPLAAANGEARGWTAGSMSMSTDTKSVLRYIGRGCLIILVAPIACTGMALYATGAILEGVAMVMKGVGAVGGNLMLPKRADGQKSPVIQSTVSWV
ncbi:hypothetical protein D9619_003814 [Psilocybe cf. subviscida]|uniref:Uncharacterized protein n=1 Tax=Psilocybe cf. subviscida TaxID=2480587 RepID=A0A8H5AWA5_9AGAR|nr:hypothetical protein D9619_003814 [Psilocybe cf. subviscida]